MAAICWRGCGCGCGENVVQKLKFSTGGPGPKCAKRWWFAPSDSAQRACSVGKESRILPSTACYIDIHEGGDPDV